MDSSEWHTKSIRRMCVLSGTGDWLQSSSPPISLARRFPALSHGTCSILSSSAHLFLFFSWWQCPSRSTNPTTINISRPSLNSTFSKKLSLFLLGKKFSLCPQIFCKTLHLPHLWYLTLYLLYYSL